MVGTGRFELPEASLRLATPRISIGGLRCGECRVGALAVGIRQLSASTNDID